jgi:PBS lyase HEAT-like repeat
LQSLRDSAQVVRRSAARALERMGDKAATPEAVGQLVKLLRDSVWCLEAASALRQIQLCSPQLRIGLLLSGSAIFRYRLWLLTGSVRVTLALGG